MRLCTSTQENDDLMFVTILSIRISRVPCCYILEAGDQRPWQQVTKLTDSNNVGELFAYLFVFILSGMFILTFKPNKC